MSQITVIAAAGMGRFITGVGHDRHRERPSPHLSIYRPWPLMIQARLFDERNGELLGEFGF